MRSMVEGAAAAANSLKSFFSNRHRLKLRPPPPPPSAVPLPRFAGEDVRGAATR